MALLAVLVGGCTGGVTPKPTEGECDTDDQDTDDDVIDDDYCYPRLVITAQSACTGNSGGNAVNCFFVLDGVIQEPDHPELASFTCISGDPCGMDEDTIYCTADYTADLYHPAEEVVGLGGDMDEICQEAADHTAGGQFFDETTTYETLADEIQTDLNGECAELLITVEAGGDCDSFANAEIGDTGMDAAPVEDVAEVLDATLTFVIDPTKSTLAIRSANQTWDSTTLEGALFALESPARYTAGYAFGGRITVDGSEIRNTWASFDTEITVDPGTGTFTISSGDLDGIGWSGVQVSNNAALSYGLLPSEGATGTFDMEEGEWTLSFAQNVTGGRRVVVEMAGQLESPL
jgi:hypothetical protein